MSQTRTTLYFIMVHHPLKGWTRVGNAYSTRANAQGWVKFVRAAWRGLPTKVRACRVTLVDGVPDAKSRERLDKEFNLDVPAQAEAKGG